MNLQIEILHPEVEGILDQLVKLKLIRITNREKPDLLKDVLNRIRMSSYEALSPESIQEEAENVRVGRREQKDSNKK